MVEKARKYDSALRDQADLSTHLQQSKQLCDKYQTENDKVCHLRLRGGGGECPSLNAQTIPRDHSLFL